MQKYRMISVIVEAVQLTEGTDFITLAGTIHGCPGDWMVIHPNGERSLCSADEFEKSYESVGDEWTKAAQLLNAPSATQRNTTAQSLGDEMFHMAP